ncbi:MAG: NAD kinase [Salibacteraceae bacterium]
MLRIAIYGRNFDDEHTPYIQRLFDQLDQIDASIVVYKRFYDYLLPRISMPERVQPFVKQYRLTGKVDFLFSIGGDGTMLDASTFVQTDSIPLIGFNTGRLGYLSAIALDEIDAALQSILDGSYDLEKRTMVKLETKDNPFGRYNLALNEITVHKKDSSSMITIHSYLNGEFLNSYWADGLIISTGTGSTAYNLSCGGPIMIPGCHNLVITPIAPHNLNVRPIVVPNDSVLTLRPAGREKSVLVSLDSRSGSIEASNELTIVKSNHKLALLRLKDHSYLRTLRHKLNWGFDRRN